LIYNETKTNLSRDELEKIVISKDEQIRNMNRKFQKMVQKIDGLTKDKELLEVNFNNLKSEKKRVAEKWHQ
jgi:hypothetical protein